MLQNPVSLPENILYPRDTGKTYGEFRDEAFTGTPVDARMGTRRKPYPWSGQHRYRALLLLQRRGEMRD